MKPHLLIAPLLLLCSTNAAAQPGGSLDVSFGDNGHVLADLSAPNRSDEGATQVLIQPDGKRVVVVDRYPYLQLIRFNADGTYDATFGEGGFSQAAPIQRFGGPRSNAAMQADGKIVVAGETEWNSTTLTDFGVARWNTNGTLDATFGNQGVVTTDFGYWDEADMVRVQPDGKLLVGGRVSINNHPFIGLVRYNSDGTLDGTFGAGGKYVNVIDVDVVDMALTPDGKLMVLGDPSGGDFALVRFNANGILDTSFGTLGSTVYDWTLNGFHPGIRCMAIQPDGRVVLGGSIFNGINSDMLVVRYHPDGTIDNTFHGDGKQTTHIGGHEGINALVVQPDGKIVAAGEVFYGTSPTRFALARYTPNGDLDVSFGFHGTQITGFAGYDGASAQAVALHADGDITAAGSAGINFTSDVALATYDIQGVGDQDGYPVQTLVADDADDGATVFLASAVQADGKVVAAGYVWNGRDHDFLVARFTTGGVLDPTFGSGGHVKTNLAFPGSGDEGAWAVAVQPDGKIVASGLFFGFTVGGALPVVRYDPDGALDASFGTGGIVLLDLAGSFEEGNAILIQPDGRIVIGGSTSNFTTDFDFVLCRLQPDGTLDPTFGSGGLVTTDFGYQDIVFGLALQPDGKILATGNTSLPNSFDGFDFCTVRYNTDGSVDTGFGTNGRVTTDFGGGFDFAETIALQSDGKVVVGGGAPIGSDFQFALARYNDDGTPDQGFGIGGQQTTGFLGYDIGTAVALQDDGKVLLAGFTQAGGDNTTGPVDFGLARYHASSGTLDGEFGSLGTVTSDFGARESAYSMNLLDRRIHVTGLKRVFREFTATDKWFGIVATYVTGPPPPDELIDNLIDDVLELPVPVGTRRSLNAKLRASLGSLAAGDTVSACNTLQAFINEVWAQSGKNIPADEAAQLIADATEIMVALDCSVMGTEILVEAGVMGATGDPVETPTRFALEQNWPNPAQGVTRFAYRLPVTGKVSLQVYNVLGQVVATLVDEVQAPGQKSVRWNATGLPSGVYYYRLTAGPFTETRKMLVVK